MDTITLPFNPTDDRITDAVILIKEVIKLFQLEDDEQSKVLNFCMPKR